MDDKSGGKTPPIEPQNFVAGVNVVDIGDIRVARGLSRRPFTGCRHKRLAYDRHERRIWCRDCEHDVEAFDAFEAIVGQFSAADSNLRQRIEAVEKAESHAVISIAAKTLDKAFRHKNMVPACPHCGLGLFPEHFRSTPTMLGKEYATAALQRRAVLNAAREKEKGK